MITNCSTFGASVGLYTVQVVIIGAPCTLQVVVMLQRTCVTLATTLCSYRRCWMRAGESLSSLASTCLPTPSTSQSPVGFRSSLFVSLVLVQVKVCIMDTGIT